MAQILASIHKPGSVYTDNSREFVKACQHLQWIPDANSLHNSEANWIAERAVRRVVALCDGMSIVLAERTRQNGRWHDNCEKRFGLKIDGPSLPFGANASYKLMSSKDESRLHQFCKKMIPGICTGRVENGRVTCSSRIAETWKTCQSAAELYVKSGKHQEGTVSFSCADESRKLFDLPRPHRGERPVGGNLEQDDLKQ